MSPAPPTGIQAPPPGVSYAHVLREADVTTGLTRSAFGLLGVLVGYGLVLPILTAGFIGIGWLLRGRPGELQAFQAEALRFEHIEGLIGTHLGIAAMILVTMVLVRRIHRREPRWLVSVQPGMRWRFLLACVLTSVVTLNLVFWVSRLGQPSGFSWAPGTTWWLLAIVLTAPLQAAGEEFLFRGYLMQAIGNVGRSPWIAVVLSGLVFAVMHGAQSLSLFVDRFAFGLLAGCLVVLTGGLEASIAAHSVNNVFAFGYAALSGGVANARTMQTSTWATTAWNLMAYLVTFALAWLVARRMTVAVRTPGSPAKHPLR